MIREYSSTDPGAPQMDGIAGSSITVLKAVLVDGYGSQPPAGWTCPFVPLSTKAVFYPGPSAKAPMYYRVVDDGANVFGAREATIQAFVSMSDLDTGLEEFPTAAQYSARSGKVQIAKSETANSTARAWRIVADARTFIMFVTTGNTTVTNAGVYAGDGDPSSPSDAYFAVLSGGAAGVALASRAIGASFIDGTYASAAAPVNPANATTFVARNASGSPGVTYAWLAYPSVVRSLGAYIYDSGGTYPTKKAPGSNVYMGPIYVLTQAATPNSSLTTGNPSAPPVLATLRGKLRALYQSWQKYAVHSSPGGFQGTGTLAGRSFRHIQKYSGGNTDGITLEISDTSGYLVVAPTNTWSVTEQVGQGGTQYLEYSLKNTTLAPLVWTTIATESWLEIVPASGTLPAFGSAVVRLQIGPDAAALQKGQHTAVARFIDSTNGNDDHERSVLLTTTEVKAAAATVAGALSAAVKKPLVAIQSYTLDSDPGWAREGDWAFGPPVAGGNNPASAYSGANVFGYNLAGNYPPDVPQAYHLTTGPISTIGYTDVRLRFKRWHGMESYTWDKSFIDVSTNGSSWTRVWQHSGTFQDSSWQSVEYSLAGAGNQATVYVRWGLGPTDYDVQYSGWNIDDIEIVGRQM